LHLLLHNVHLCEHTVVLLTNGGWLVVDNRNGERAGGDEPSRVVNLVAHGVDSSCQRIAGANSRRSHQAVHGTIVRSGWKGVYHGCLTDSGVVALREIRWADYAVPLFMEVRWVAVCNMGICALRMAVFVGWGAVYFPKYQHFYELHLASAHNQWIV